MVRTYQGGSILSFLVIGGVMVLLLVGGAYLVRNYLAPSNGDTGLISRQDDNAPDTTDTSDNAPDEPAKEEEPVKKEDEETSENSGSGGATQQPSEPQPEEDVAENQSPAATDLPSTGPEDFILEAILISSMVAFAAAYLQSRQSATSL